MNENPDNISINISNYIVLVADKTFHIKMIIKKSRCIIHSAVFFCFPFSSKFAHIGLIRALSEYITKRNRTRPDRAIRMRSILILIRFIILLPCTKVLLI